jgi:hypothetical protein
VVQPFDPRDVPFDQTGWESEQSPVSTVISSRPEPGTYLSKGRAETRFKHLRSRIWRLCSKFNSVGVVSNHLDMMEGL